MTLLVLSVGLTACGPAPKEAPQAQGHTVAPEPQAHTPLHVIRGDGTSADYTAEALTGIAPEERVEAFDPYYDRVKRWRAVPLAPVLHAALGADANVGTELILTATDGYTVPISAARLLEPGAYIAFADADGPWQPIGPKSADPAPFYIVWSGPDQQDPETYPRPWSLASITVAAFEDVFPRVVPPPDSAAEVEQGFAVWRAQCLRCHAINQQGGKVGPELNIPRNVTEYRDDAFLRSWIRDPSSYRPTVMPSFTALSDTDLDAVLAYLRAMRGAKDLTALPGAKRP